MGLTMKHAGVAITVTSLTDFIVFAIGATTVSRIVCPNFRQALPKFRTCQINILMFAQENNFVEFFNDLSVCFKCFIFRMVNGIYYFRSWPTASKKFVNLERQS